MAEPGLSRGDVLALLREHKPVLTERFGVVDLDLFGSTGRDEAQPDSDIDILVSFDRPTDPVCHAPTTRPSTTSRSSARRQTRRRRPAAP